MKHKDFRNFLNCESAVSEIIGFILLLAIAVGMIALIQTQSVPEWNKAVEMDHYNVVYDDFMKIRSDIEDVALFQFPKSSVIHMGAHYPDRLIFINPADTSGTLTLENVWINVSYTDSAGNTKSPNFSSTSIRFDPNYNYYSNAASFIYEHGLVIKNFTDNNYIYTDNRQNIIKNNTLNITSLDSPQESVSFSDIKTMNYYLESKTSTENNTNVTVTFYTNYPLLWDALLKKDNLNYNISGNTINVAYTNNTTINTYIVNGSIASGTGVSTELSPVLTNIMISPPAPWVLVGEISTFTAEPKDQFGNAMTATVTVTWSSSNTTVGTINTEGVFTALTFGTTTITAYNGSVNGTANVTVTVPVCQDAPDSYPTDRWDRLWCNFNSSEVFAEKLADIPDESNVTFDNNWGSGVVGTIRQEYIGFRSGRTIYIPVSDNYSFTVGSDDGIRVWIDDTLVLDKWIPRSYTIDTIYSTLSAGNHTFRIDYYELTGDARVSFNYSVSIECPSAPDSYPTDRWDRVWCTNLFDQKL